jgi:5-carboxymethyl-2-hydroxymuconic-semialdehyde dehydrogenase
MKLGEASVAGVAVDTRHWIGGRRLASPGTFTDLSPIAGQPLAGVARGGEAEVAAALQAAREAFGGWSQTPPPGRAAVLYAIADGIERRIEDLSQVETCDNGALLRSHRRSVMPRVAQNFRFLAGWLGELDGGGLEISGHREQVSWAPAGVTAVITPWNAPLMLASWRIAPALAAGNTVVAKPPEWAPLTASLLAGITREAGLPDGVFNVVQGLGGEAGAALVVHPDLARVAFTGSAATGRLVAAAAGAQLTPVSLELGGKSPLLVFADADLDLPVGHAVGQHDNAGQVCLAGTRLLVEEPVAGEFTACFTERAAALRQGDPRDEAIDIGPNITREHLARVDGFVRRAVAAGARLLLGGAGLSGIGREGGTWSFDFYADVKNTVYAGQG